MLDQHNGLVSDLFSGAIRKSLDELDHAYYTT